MTEYTSTEDAYRGHKKCTAGYWPKIATKVKPQSNKDCAKKWYQLTTNPHQAVGKSRTKWTSEEDVCLRTAVLKFGDKKI
jgi:hypothetical protein